LRRTAFFFFATRLFCLEPSGDAFDLMADGEILQGVTEFSVDCVPGAILCNRAA